MKHWGTAISVQSVTSADLYHSSYGCTSGRNFELTSEHYSSYGPDRQIQKAETMDFDELIPERAEELRVDAVLASPIIYQQFQCVHCNISFPTAIPVSFGVVSVNCPNCLDDKKVEYMEDIPAELFERFEWEFPLSDDEKALYGELKSRKDGIQLRFDLDWYVRRPL